MLINVNVEAIRRVNEQIDCLTDIIDELVKEQGEDAMVEDVKEALRSVIKKYLPLPTWENETINRAFSENGKADDDHRTAQS